MSDNAKLLLDFVILSAASLQMNCAKKRKLTCIKNEKL